MSNVLWIITTRAGCAPDREWEALKDRPKEAYRSVLATIKSVERWDGENEMGGSLAVLVHTPSAWAKSGRLCVW